MQYRHVGIFKDLIILLMVSLASFWKLLGSSNIITIHDWVFPTNFNQYLQLSLQSWNPLINLGLNIPSANTNLPLAWTFYLLSKIGLTPGQIDIVFLIGVVFAAGMSMYLLSMYLTGGKRLAGVIAAIVYMFNPFVVDNMLWGNVPLQAAYALIPLMLLCFIVAMDRFSVDKYLILFSASAGILLAIISCLAIQYAYIGVVLLAMWIIAAFSRILIKKRNLPTLRGMAKSATVLLITSSVAAISRLNLVIQVFSSSLNVGQIPFQLTNLYSQSVVYQSDLIGGIQNTIRLRYRVYSFYEGFENQALQTWHIPSELLLIATSIFVILVFAAVFLPKRNRSIIWFALIVLVFAYLSAGTNTPINVYSWLFQNVYGFFIFREPSKFIVGVALGSSYLLGVTISRIYEFLGKVNLRFTVKHDGQLVSKLNLKHRVIHLKLAKPMVALLLFVVIWPNVFPLAQGNFGGLNVTTYPKGYEDVSNWLAGQPGNFRVLILPLSMMGNWSLPTLPPWPSVGYADLPFINSPPQPIIIQPSAIAMNQGTQNILYYLENLIYTGQIDLLASLLSVLNVKYVVVAPLTETSPFDIFVQSYNQVLECMQKTPSLVSVYSSEGYYIFENLKFSGQVYTTNAPSLAFGNLNLLSDLMSGTQATLPALVYGYGLNPATLSSIAAVLNGVILQGDRFLDYVLQSIDNQYLVPLAQYIPSYLNDPTASWILSTAYPRPISGVYASGEFYSSSGFVYTNGVNTSLGLKYQNRAAGEQQIWIRSAEGPEAGNIQISVGSNVFPLLSLYSQQFQGFQWRFVGNISIGTDMQNLSVKSLNGTNLVDSLVIVPTDVFNTAYTKCINSLEDRGLTFEIDPSTFTNISGYESVANEPKTLDYLGLTEAKASEENGLLAVTITNTHNVTISYGFNIYVNGVGYTIFSIGAPLAPGQSFTGYYDREALGNFFPNPGDPIQIQPFWVIKTNASSWTTKEIFSVSSTYTFGENNGVIPVASLNLTIPFSSNFDLFLHAQATAGTVRLNVAVDNSTFSTIISASAERSNGTIKTGSIKLDEGIHKISLEVDSASEGNLTFFDLQLVRSSLNSSSTQTAMLQPNFDSFTHATIHTNISQKAFLIYSASYDPGWNLRTNTGQLALHVETNGFSNGWFIPQSNSDNGELILDLSFGPQTLLNITIIVNIILIATIVGAIIFILIQRRVRKDKNTGNYGILVKAT
jgi:hypothetical protein